MIEILGYRNAFYTSESDTHIELEINTAKFGWIPINIDFQDTYTESHLLEIQQWLLDNIDQVTPYTALVISSEEKIEYIINAVQKHLDVEAQSKGYDNIFTAVTYADESIIPDYQKEGKALRKWRSLVWKSCQDLLDEWANGDISEPTPQEVIDQLPTITY